MNTCPVKPGLKPGSVHRLPAPLPPYTPTLWHRLPHNGQDHLGVVRVFPTRLGAQSRQIRVQFAPGPIMTPFCLGCME